MIDKLTVDKPWGAFVRYTHNQKSTVKLLEVKPNSKLSLQYHHKRDEHWTVLRGNPLIVVDGKTYKAEPGMEFFIPKKKDHRIMTEDSHATIMEISFGEFDEEDIVRLEDSYDR